MLKKIEMLLPYILFGFLLGFVLVFVSNCCGKEPQTVYIDKTEIKHDTTIIQGKIPDPIIIKKTVPIERVDTVFLDSIQIIKNPFAVCLDTIADKDTIKVCYTYPLQEFSYMIRKPAPEIRVITITKDNYIEESDWYKALYFVAGASTMYVTQQLSK
jgi:hypothetical protein